MGVGFPVRQAQGPEPVEEQTDAVVADVEIGDHLGSDHRPAPFTLVRTRSRDSFEVM